MLRMLLPTGVALLLPLAVSIATVAQVDVSVSSSTFKPEERIQAAVVNKSGAPVSYCVEFGQSSPHGETRESTPLPFYIEKHGAEKWGVLLVGPDIGSARHPVTLASATSQGFPFRLRDTGNMRLMLHYWASERADVCARIR
jgi:hypothetical protein